MWTRGGETWRQFQVLCEENTGLRLGCVSKVGRGESLGEREVGVLMGFVLLEHIYTNGSLAARNSFSKNCRVFFEWCRFCVGFFLGEKKILRHEVED